MRGIPLGLVLLALADSASACSCIRNSPEQWLDGAANIAVVRVNSVRLDPRFRAALGKSEGHREHAPLLANVEVVETLRGTLPEGVRLASGFGEGDCGLPMVPGTDILVAGTVTGDVLSLSYCSASRVLGIRSLSTEAGVEAWIPLRADAYLAGVRRYLRDGAPLHECLFYDQRPPSPTEDLESLVAECNEVMRNLTGRTR